MRVFNGLILIASWALGSGFAVIMTEVIAALSIVAICAVLASKE